MNEPQQTLGFAHFLLSGDAISKGLLIILLGMSVVSWTLILVKGVTYFLRRRHAERFLKMFWEAPSMQAVARDIASHGVHDSFSRVTANALQAVQHYARTGANGGRMAESGSPADFLTRTIKKVLDEETVSAENGLSVLATVGATAPFFGLFGTVWGVYHGRGPDHDRSGSGRGAARRHRLQLAGPAQPRGVGQARRLRLRAVHLPVIGPDAERSRRQPYRTEGSLIAVFRFSVHGALQPAPGRQAPRTSSPGQSLSPAAAHLSEGLTHHGICQF